MAKKINDEAKNDEEQFAVENLEEDVIMKTARFAGCAICP